MTSNITNYKEAETECSYCHEHMKWDDIENFYYCDCMEYENTSYSTEREVNNDK